MLRRAQAVLAEHVRRTPLLCVTLPNKIEATLKLECLQHSGSFKARGAFWSVLSAPERPSRLVAASGGNHGLAVGYVGRALGIATQVFVPTIASPVKIEAIKATGAEVIQVGENYAAALAASQEAAAMPGVLALHAYDAPATVAGQATLAVEFLDQAPELDTVVVAVGGGGLIAGVASALPTSVRVVGVETDGCATYSAAQAAGQPTQISPRGVAADALGASVIGEIAWRALSARSVESILVSDEQAMAARRWLWDNCRIVVEPAGAVALAAVMAGAVSGDRVGVVLCGSNTDPSDLV